VSRQVAWDVRQQELGLSPLILVFPELNRKDGVPIRILEAFGPPKLDNKSAGNQSNQSAGKISTIGRERTALARVDCGRLSGGACVFLRVNVELVLAFWQDAVELHPHVSMQQVRFRARLLLIWAL
jgi:hypothetical protein